MARAKAAEPDLESFLVCPQAGPQMAFLQSDADVAGCGGARGGGKTTGMLFDPIYDIHRPDFTAVLFRRTYPEIMQEGGLWDSSRRIRDRNGRLVPFYPSLRAAPRESDLEWNFPSGASVRFAHMQHAWDADKWLGSQIPWIGFDQLESFEPRQFWDMFSCNRSMCGAHNRIRFSCNPDPDHFLRDLLRWWIDDDSGLAILERAGVKRWFARTMDGDIIWGDTKSEVEKVCGDDCEPLSFAFFPSTVYDNPLLLKGDPAYLSKLKMLPRVDRERMLGGNWNVRNTAGSFFKEEMFVKVKVAPVCVQEVRYWDTAASAKKGDGTKQSASAGVLMGLTENGMAVVKHVHRDYLTADGVDQAQKTKARQDGEDVVIWIEQEPGGSGKARTQDQIRKLHGFEAYANPVHESKGNRASIFAAQVQAGNVMVVEAPWNAAYFRELENFDGTQGNADQVDASSGAYLMLTENEGAGVW